MIHGYARTSTKSQRDDMQLQALEAAGVEKICSEVASGAATTRPVLDKMLAGATRRELRAEGYGLDA